MSQTVPGIRFSDILKDNCFQFQFEPNSFTTNILVLYDLIER